MELFDSSKHGTLSAFFSHNSSSFITYPGTDFLLKPIFIRGFSGSLHLVLLFVLLVSWVWTKFKVGDGEGPKQRFGSIQSWYYKLTLLCCLGVSGLSLVFCLLNYFYWHRNDWSEEKLVTLFDLAIRTLAWGALCIYLHTQFSNSSESKFPNLLRVWWGSYFSISCYSLVIDILFHKEDVSLPVQSLVFDVVCVISGLFFIYVGFFGKKEGRNTILEEPLLNGNGNAESNDSKGGTPVTPYSNAGIFSILTFSWMGPLIALGNKKTLDLEDVPELYKGDSVLGSFPNFRNKLEARCHADGRVTTFRLVKAIDILGLERCWLDRVIYYILHIGILCRSISNRHICSIPLWAEKVQK
ncbi:unnamed protein product [Prunus brigantina]